MRLQYSQRAIKDLKSFAKPEQILIAKKLEYLRLNFEELKKSKKVTELKGTEFKNQFRFVVARKIRVIFRIEENNLILLVLRVGSRKDIYT